MAAGWLLHDLLSGGGLAGLANGAGHPTLAVFVFPLLLVAAWPGSSCGHCGPGHDSAGRSGSLPTAAFLALSRLSAAGGC